MKDISEMFSENVKAMDVSPVRKMFDMANGVENPINLTIGAPNFPIPEEIKKVAVDSIFKDKNAYTPTAGILELRKKVALKLKEKNGVVVDASNVLITNAVSGGLSIALITLVDSGDEVLVIDPYFVLYKTMIREVGGIPVVCKSSDDFSLDLDEIKGKISNKTKAILINSPNNPSGKVYSEEELRGLVDIAKERGIFIISDEIYEDFVYGPKHFSCGNIYDRVITLNGFSKTYAMTGWRVGYMCGPSEFIAQATKVAQSNYVCAPTPFQHAALVAMDVDMSEYVLDYAKKAEYLYNSLSDVGYEMNKPEGAFYFFIRYPYDADKFVERCLDNKLLIVPGGGFSESNTHFRISFCQDMNVLERAVDVLKKIVKE